MRQSGYIPLALIMILCLSSVGWADGDFLISSKKAGNIAVDGLISQISVKAPFKLTRLKKMVKSEGYTEERVYFALSDGSRHLLEIYPQTAEGLSQTSGKVGELMVFSEKYKTDKGIGPKSSAGDFIKAYPNYTLWYTYVSDRFILETSQLPDVQFFLDSKGYKGKKDKLYQKDMVKLKISEFDTKAPIKTIRIF